MSEPLHRDKPTRWMEWAACQGLDADLFFPPRGANSVPRSEVAQAKRTCASCRVREDCLAYALTEPPERHGMWGGLTPKERSRIRGRRVR